MISTASTGLTAGTAAIAVAGGELPIYHARPAAGDKLPVVLVAQEIFGVHEHIRDVCRRLAHAGYLAIAPSCSSARAIRPPSPTSPRSCRTSSRRCPTPRSWPTSTPAPHGRRRGDDPARLAVTGFCWGGRITWLYAAHNPAVRAGGVVRAPERSCIRRLTGHPLTSPSITAPVPVSGSTAADQGILPADVEKMQAALAAAGGQQDPCLSRRPAFHADYRPSYRKAEAEDGWKRTLEHFATALG